MFRSPKNQQMKPVIKSFSALTPKTFLATVGLVLCSLPGLSQTPPPTDPKPEPIRTSITVNDSIAAETPANISNVTAVDLKMVPGTNLDDRLRQVPGFTLFRRNSSVTANPTTQGVSLRGMTSSGTSRTLVLLDSVPMNDPFGGWVYWTRFLPDDLDHIEISRGAATSLFGDLAMGGAISLFRPEPLKNHYSFGYDAGTRNTHDVWGGYGTMWKHWAASVSARAFTTDGYYVVPTPTRGAVDRKANVRFATGTTRLDWHGDGQRLFIELGILAEERGNGTYLTSNSTGLGTLSVHYLKQWTNDGISLVGFHSREQYHASFTAVSNNRNTEKTSYFQTVPSQSLGASTVWNHTGGWWNGIAGGDFNKAQGTGTDHLLPTGLRVGGGNLLQHGEFLQGDVHVRDFKFFAGARHQFTGAGHQFFSPSGGLVYGRKQWRVRGSVYRAFRAPTLNELYREFRVGNIDTLPNTKLQQETLFGSEFGADWTGESSSLRVTAFRNSLKNVITNVTLSTTPALITRQRRNAAAAVARGIEANARKRWRRFQGQLQYMYVASAFDTGLLLPQVSKHQGSADIIWSRPGTMASFSLRSYSNQFDDDKNTFLLPGYATIGFVLQQHLYRHLSANLAIENALDRLYYTGYTPNPTNGAPGLVRVGLRWSL